MDKKKKILFITVGTTHFDEMMKTIDNEYVGYMLIKNGFNKVVVQIGRTGSYQLQHITKLDKLHVETFDLKPSLDQYYLDSDMVISHCGAGTLLESLHMKKLIIAVVNNTLMDNHQLELMEELKKHQYIYGVENHEELPQKLEEILNYSSANENRREYKIEQKNKIQSVIQDFI